MSDQQPDVSQNPHLAGDLQSAIAKELAAGVRERDPGDSDFELGQGDPVKNERREELEDAAQRAADRELDEETPVSRAEHERIKQQLHDVMGFIEKLGREGHANLDFVAKQAFAEKQRRARYEEYDKLRNETVLIEIHPHEIPARNTPVHLSLNGEQLRIPRGVPTRIPGRFLSVLDECLVDSWAKEVNPLTGKPQLVNRRYLQYPYSRLSHVGAAYLADFSAGVQGNL